MEVLRRLRETIDDPRVIHLVGLLLDRPAVGARTSPGERGLGLHQGSPLSPLLCNLYLDIFDRAMLAAGYRVLRYGDDLAVPADSRADAEKALVTAATELDYLRLELNSGKCDVVSFDEGVPFLGETTTASTLHRGEMLSHPLETSVYVDRQGAVVRVRGDRLVVTADDDEGQEEALLRLSLRRIRQVVCYGRVSLTTPFLHRAAERGIEVVLLTDSGGLGARLASPMASDPQARRAQYATADDERRSRRIASAFVAGKLANMRTAVLRAARPTTTPTPTSPRKPSESSPSVSPTQRPSTSCSAWRAPHPASISRRGPVHWTPSGISQAGSAAHLPTRSTRCCPTATRCS